MQINILYCYTISQVRDTYVRYLWLIYERVNQSKESEGVLVCISYIALKYLNDRWYRPAELVSWTEWIGGRPTYGDEVPVCSKRHTCSPSFPFSSVRHRDLLHCGSSNEPRTPSGTQRLSYSLALALAVTDNRKSTTHFSVYVHS